tara:strand:+ start:100 stop:735 length:636 start_codon:yes stop_codon:yes gene_type:complete
MRIKIILTVLFLIFTNTANSDSPDSDGYKQGLVHIKSAAESGHAGAIESLQALGVNDDTKDILPFEGYAADLVKENLSGDGDMLLLYEGTHRCLAMTVLMIDSGYAEGEGLSGDYNKSLDAYWYVSYGLYLKLNGLIEEVVKNGVRDEEKNDEYLSLYRNRELEAAILKYANWINSNNITFEYIEENTSHPLRVERSSCLKMGLELDQMIN